MRRIALAALSLAILGVGPAVARPKLATLPSLACASGYHADVGGNCQPNAAERSRYCPPGTVFHPEFEGWRCDPPPPGAY